MIEAGAAKYGTPTATGTLTDTDVDNPPNTFRRSTSPTASDAGYGTFTMTADGVWTYTLDDDNCAVQALDDGDTLTDTFTVTTVDGTAQVVTITIHGSNDADPNDFDHLATGKKVISDPPYRLRNPRRTTPSRETAMTARKSMRAPAMTPSTAPGKSDLIYAGSGNDTHQGR